MKQLSLKSTKGSISLSVSIVTIHHHVAPANIQLINESAGNHYLSASRGRPSRRGVLWWRGMSPGLRRWHGSFTRPESPGAWMRAWLGVGIWTAGDPWPCSKHFTTGRLGLISTQRRAVNLSVETMTDIYTHEYGTTEWERRNSQWCLPFSCWVRPRPRNLETYPSEDVCVFSSYGEGISLPDGFLSPSCLKRMKVTRTFFLNLHLTLQEGDIHIELTDHSKL